MLRRIARFEPPLRCCIRLDCGYGLSYTTFTYDRMKLSSNTLSKDGKLTASIQVKNTGARAGKETVQLYIHDVISSSTRPVKELKGFKQIE